MTGILQGMRIVEASAFVAAPLAGMTLAQMGADVIRVDPIGGGLDQQRWPLTAAGQSLYWAGLNKDKRSVMFDLRSAAGRNQLAALIAAPGADAGIFITNLGAGAVPSYEELARLRTDIIMVQIVGNPDGSPAVDYTVNCAVGFPQITGPAALAEPVNHVLPAWDVLCGTTAAMAVLAAERHRRKSGQGQYVRIALADVAMATAGHLGYLAEAQINGVDRPRHGNALYGSFGRDFITRDGRRLMIVAVTARQWTSLVAAMDLADAITCIERERGIDCRRETDRWLAREALFALVEAWAQQRDFSDVRTTLERHEVLWGAYQTFAELLGNDPRCSSANPIFTEIDQPGIGRHLAPGSSIHFAAVARVPPKPAPPLGGHTDEVLAQILGRGTPQTTKEAAAGIEHLRQWVGRSETSWETLALEPALRFIATLDDEVTQLRAHDALPPLWHWLYFLPDAPTRDIGADGHPRRGGFLPPVGLPRRMFAGSNVTFHAPLLIGELAERRREVVSVEEKSGRNGPLVFVTVGEQIMQLGRLCIEEQQTIVYRSPGPPPPAPPAIPSWPEPPSGAWVRTLTPDPALLFRFSALTFNAHRIHYDRMYARNEEGYPGLVVHGTLLALLLMELARHHETRRVRQFSFRALRPVFDLSPFRLVGTPGAGCITLAAQGPDGTTATEAEVSLAGH